MRRTPSGRFAVIENRRYALAGLAALLLCMGWATVGCSESNAEVQAGGGSSGGREIGWNDLRVGMAPDEVLRTLGDPLDVRVEPINTIWYYSDARSNGPFVVFDTHGMSVSHWRRSKP